MRREEAEQRIVELERKNDRLERIVLALADSTAAFVGCTADAHAFADVEWRDRVTATVKTLRVDHPQPPAP